MSECFWCKNLTDKQVIMEMDARFVQIAICEKCFDKHLHLNNKIIKGERRYEIDINELESFK